MTYEQIINDLKNKVYHPVYFLTGDEPFYIDSVSNYIEEHVLEEAEKSFNQNVLYGKETSVQDIVSEAKRFPMMSNHNVVIVKEAQHLSKKLDDLIPYLENPLSSTILVFEYKYKTLDKRTKIYKNLTKNKHVVYFESKKLYDNQLPDWVINFVKSKGFSINPKAAMLLSEFVGNDLSRLSNEIEKLFINLKPGDEITSNHIEENIGISKEFNNFELNKAIATLNIKKANQIVLYFSKNEKNNPIFVTISTLYNFFTNILKYHYTKDKSSKNLAAALGISPYFLNEYHTAARNFTIRRAVKAIETLKIYDLKAKGVDNASTTQGELLKELIFQLLN